MKEIKYITVLDFIKGNVYQYKVNPKDFDGNWNPDQEPIEEFLVDEGHDLSNCQWMVHDKPRVVKRYTIM